MRKREGGQAITEYALALVLVAIVVIAVVQLLGPIIGGVFCEINSRLDSVGGLVPSILIRVGGDLTPEIDTSQTVTMDIGDDLVTIDAKVGICGPFSLFGDVVTNASHGIANHLGDGIFTYEPYDKQAGFDDSFTYSWSYTGPPHNKTGLVTIIVGEPDLVMSQSNVLSTAEDNTREKKPISKPNDVQEDIIALMEAAVEQEGKLQEGVDLTVEGLEEGLENLIEFADDTGNILLSDSLSQLLTEVKAGNLDSVQDTIIQLGADLALAPVEVWLDTLLKMAPSLTKSCVVVSEATVSSEAINVAFEAIEGLDDDHPGKAEALLLLQGAVATIEERNTAAAEYAEFQSAVLQTFVAAFEFVGEYEIAAQLAADSEACGN